MKKNLFFIFILLALFLNGADSLKYYNQNYNSDFFDALKISPEENEGFPLEVKIQKNDTINAWKYNVRFIIVSKPEGSKAYLKDSDSLTGKDGVARTIFFSAGSKGRYVIKAVIGDDYQNPLYINVEVLKSNWYLISIFGLLGGLALFLFGMNRTGSGLKNLTGQHLKLMLTKVTKYKLSGYLLGVFSTFLMQSSSAVSVLLIGFTSAGLLTFRQSLSVLLGSCLGTTLTVQMISFNVGDVALLFVFLGFIMETFTKSHRFQLIGRTVMGFGLLFYGMKIMSLYMTPLRGFPFVIDLLKTLENSPLMAIFVSTIFTALVQSSAATIGILLSLSGQGMMNIQGAIAFIFGANIGTAITGILASIGQTRQAKKIAYVNVLFKIIGVLIFLPFISSFASFIASFNWDSAHSIANAHTIFNLTFTLLLLPFTAVIGKLTSKIFRNNSNDSTEFKVKYLNESMLDSPEIALDHVVREILRMGEILDQMFRKIPDFLTTSDLGEIDKSRQADDKIDYLEENIKNYLVKLSRKIEDDHKLQLVNSYIVVANILESMGDILVRTTYSTITKIRTEKLPLSEEGLKEILFFHDKVLRSYRHFVLALRREDYSSFKEIIDIYKPEIRRLENEFMENHIERLKKGSLETTATSSRHVDLLNSIKRFNSLTHNLTYQMLDVLEENKKF